MTDEPFKVGDVVELKSGGPQMVVTELSEKDRAYCEWFDDKKLPQGNSFPAAALRHYRPPQWGTSSR